MEIDAKTLQDGDIVYGCAFDIDFDRSTYSGDKVVHTRCKPVKGIIENDSSSYWHRSYFTEFGKNGKLKKSSSVRVISRVYAKTYEECVELYNSMIENKQKKLRSIADEIEKEKIEIL